MVGVEGRATEILDRYRVAFVSLAIAALTLLAGSNRFVQDDAFVTLRYAQNLAEGAGLTWNPGERVEGYTNFLWALLLVVAFRLGIDPV
jgi:arabinofuranosyltransferase